MESRKPPRQGSVATPKDLLHGPVGDAGLLETGPMGGISECLVEGKRLDLGVQADLGGPSAARLGFEGVHERPPGTAPPCLGPDRHPLRLAGSVGQHAQACRAEKALLGRGEEVGAVRIEAVRFFFGGHPLLVHEDLDPEGEQLGKTLVGNDLDADHGAILCQNRPVNFLGHAVVAGEHRDEPRFVLGAMLPDLTAMAGGRMRGVEDADLAEGVRHHHAADEVFHATPIFARLVTETTRELQERGLRRGPARAVGHVGIELLLDGWWVRQYGVPATYDEALRTAPALESALQWRGPVAPDLLGRACTRLLELDIAAGYARPREVAARLARVLSRRPRLAFADGETEIVAEWAEGASSALGDQAEALFDEVRRGLGQG